MARMRAWLSRRVRGILPTRNDDLFSGTRLRSRQWRSVDLRPVVVFVLRGGRGRCRRLTDDLKLIALNNDPLDGVAHQCARLDAPAARRAISRELGSRQLPPQHLDHQPLDIVSIDAGARARIGSAVTQQRAADIVAIAVGPAHRIGRRHDVAAVIINQAGKEGAGLRRKYSALPTFRISRILRRTAARTQFSSREDRG
jgi:hypothetical protein